MNDEIWSLYLVRCADNTLYCGIAKGSIERRVAMHNAGRGAQYTKFRTPVKLVYSEICGEQGTALRREFHVKRMSRERKEDLIRGGARPRLMR